MPARRPSQDASQEALRAVERVTGSKSVKGEDLLADPLRRKYFKLAMP